MIEAEQCEGDLQWSKHAQNFSWEAKLLREMCVLLHEREREKVQMKKEKVKMKKVRELNDD